MSAAVVASRSITGHSVAGVNRIALTRSIRRDTASDESGVGVALGACDVEAPGLADWADEAGSAARFAPQLPQNVASSAIVVPHFGQFMSSAPLVETIVFAGTFCAESDGRFNERGARHRRRNAHRFPTLLRFGGARSTSPCAHCAQTIRP